MRLPTLLLVLFLLTSALVDAAWYAYSQADLNSPKERSLTPPKLDPGMNPGPLEEWFDNLPVDRSAGDAVYYTVGTVHVHLTDCPLPDSDSFNCVRAAWTRRFREGLGTHTEYCKAIFVKELRELCEGSAQADLDSLERDAPGIWVTRKNPTNLPEDEWLEALILIGDLPVPIQECPAPHPGLSADCLEAIWQVAFSEWIPRANERYCDIITNATFNRLCHTGVEFARSTQQ